MLKNFHTLRLLGRYNLLNCENKKRLCFRVSKKKYNFALRK